MKGICKLCISFTVILKFHEKDFCPSWLEIKLGTKNQSMFTKRKGFFSARFPVLGFVTLEAFFLGRNVSLCLHFAKFHIVVICVETAFL